MLTLKELATLTGRTLHEVRNDADRGKLSTVKRGNTRFVSDEEIERYRRENKRVAMVSSNSDPVCVCGASRSEHALCGCGIFDIDHREGKR